MEGEIKEKRGGPLDEVGARAVVSPKEEGKEREMGGVRYGERRCGVESRPDAGKGEVHSAQRWRALHDAASTQKWDATDPDTNGVRRARSEITRHA